MDRSSAPQAPCGGTILRQFAEHLNAPIGVAGTAFEFDVPWMPPIQEVGRLEVYVAAVAANDDGTQLAIASTLTRQTLTTPEAAISRIAGAANGDERGGIPAEFSSERDG